MAATFVTWGSLVCGVLCFMLYGFLSLAAVVFKPEPVKAANAKTAGLIANSAVSVDEVTKLVEALSKLTDSLAKAGPALTSLIGALLFFLIAALNSGAYKGASCAAPVTAKAGAASPATIASAAGAKPGG